MTKRYTLRCYSLLLLAAGYGWAGGHFIPAGAGPLAYVFQFVMLFLLLVFGVGYLRAMAGAASSHVRLRRNVIALNIFAALTFAINIANIVHGMFVQGPFGSHNTFGDLVPIGMILAGDIGWLLTATYRSAFSSFSAQSGRTQ
jgi:hypothetical protein